MPPRAPRKPAAKKAPATKAPATKAAAATAKAAKPAKRVPRAAVAAPVPEPIAEPVTEPVAAPAAERVDPYEWRPAEVLGDAEERDPDEPVVVPEPPVETGAPWALRVLRGDWREPLAAAGAGLAATLVLAAVAVATLLAVSAPGSDERLVGETSGGRFLRYVGSAVGLAFGSSVSVAQSFDTPEGFPEAYALRASSSSIFAVRFAPLLVTILALLALRAFVRRRGEEPADRAGAALRTAVVFGAGVAVVAALGRWSLTDGGDDDPFFGAMSYEFTTSPWRALFWATLAAFAVVWLSNGPVAVPERFRDWTVAARAAVVGLVTGLVLSFLLMVALGYVYAENVDATAGDVTKAVPLAVAFAPNTGAAAFGWASAGTHPRGGGAVGRFAAFGQADLSPWIYLATLIPVVAVVVAVLWLRRRVAAPELARVASFMALPAAAAWLVLAWASSVRMGTRAGFGLAAFSGAGPAPWYALVVLLWFGAGGWAVARLLGRRAEGATR